MEWQLFDGDTPHVSTYEFHEHRDRAAHLESPIHRPRLLAARGMVLAAARLVGSERATVVDLGCGDGGLLSIVQDEVCSAWGYDFTPANAAGWAERGVKAEALDVFGADRGRVQLGDIVVLTEVLEHIADPHGVLRWLYGHGLPRFLVCSSPWDEHAGRHDECHSWAWDQPGYRNLVAAAGWRILRHDLVGRFQLVMGMRL